MYNIITITLIFFAFLMESISSPLLAAPHLSSEMYENKQVANIHVTVENLPRGASFNQDRILSKLRTKIGDPFTQITFDHDLKTLSEEYERVEPTIETQQQDVYINIKLWKKPMIRGVNWNGNNKISTRTLQKELGIKAQTLFNREEFNKAFNKVKEYYIKKGYFESSIEYKLIPYANTNEVDIEINVAEGHSGYISQIKFTGLTKKEESAILGMINTKKHNFFTSWLTGKGTYHEEALEHDKLIIVNYLQNEGYANAHINLQTKENKEGLLEIYINANKGNLFHFGNINISGNTLLSEEKIKDVMLVKEGSSFSPENLRESIENIKKLYGKDGYIETGINYTLSLAYNESVYDINITINEGDQFKIGLIRILGNSTTNKNVILRESLLVPGEVFDSRRLEATQMRLESIGYFKSVNVYAVKTPEDQQLGENYRDVVVEVEETTTGNLSLFFGFSTVDDLFGGLDLAENNFDYRGLTKWWREGMSSFRGAGEYAHARVQIGKKQQSYTLSWMDPYFRDTNWRFGFDINYSISRLQSDDYSVHSFGGSLFGSYPLNAYWTYGWKIRLRNSIIKIAGIQSQEAQNERQNSGLTGGVGTSISFDSRDNAFKPHRGFRSIMEVELAGVKRHSSYNEMFPFFSMGYINTYYYPVWRKGTLKMRWDLKFLYPFGEGKPELLPLSERYFLGGETTIRGYKPFIIGPKFKKQDSNENSNEPTGGVSSTLISVEYLQQIFPMLDLFVFFDGGSVSLDTFDIPNFRMSYGTGARIELANRIPIILGVGFPIHPVSKDEVKHFFISMGGQF